MEFEFKLKPFDHQLKTFEKSKDREYYGILWEPGTGKTKITLDTAGYLFSKDKIDGLLVLAPNVIHENWVLNEIPKHLPNNVLTKTKSFVYHSLKAKTRTTQNELLKLHNHKGLSVLCITYDAISTKHGFEAAKTFLKKRYTLLVADESTRIKNPKRGVKRTKAALALSDLAEYKRILTGTPVDNSPFDLYSQMLFLDKSIWRNLRITSYFGFKTRFAVWEKGYNRKIGRDYPVLVAYRDLDRLKKYISYHSNRVTKDDVLDLPPKLYSTCSFDLSKKQRQVYDDLKRNMIIQLQDGSISSCELAITLLIRLQQITSGYVLNDEEKVVEIDEKNRPRIDALLESVNDIPHQCIIWAKFHKDVELICKSLGKDAIRADGTVSAEDRMTICNDFQEGKYKFVVSNPAALGEGVTLNKARTVVYYNNGFKLSNRIQSEDRAHRIGQKYSVNYIDIVARNTVDEQIIQSLLKKVDIASQITGDTLKKWIDFSGHQSN